MPLTPEDKQLITECCKDIPLYSAIFFPNYIKGLIPEFHRDMYDFYQSEGRYKIVRVPRGHSKSTNSIIVYASHQILFNEAKFVVVISDTGDQAMEQARNLKTEFEFNETIAHFFGPQKTDKWADSNFELLNGAKVISVGATKSIRGMMHGGQRPDLVIIDDLENDELVANKERRDKLLNWVYASLLPAMAPDGRFIINGNVIHFDSILYRLEEDKRFKSIHFEAELDAEKEIALWPKHLPWSELMKIRAGYEAQGRGHIYYMEYLNKPVSPKDAPFRKEDFRYYRLESSATSLSDRKDLASKGIPIIDPWRLRRYVLLDGAESKADRACYSAVTCIGLDQRGRMYVLEYDRRRMDPDELVSAIMRMCYKWNPYYIGCEKTLVEKMIGYALRDEMRRSDKFWPIEMSSPNKAGSKITRILEIMPLVRRHRFFMLPTMGELEEEMITCSHFVEGPYCDILDSIEDFFQISPEPLTIPEDDSDEEWEDGKEEVLYNL